MMILETYLAVVRQFHAWCWGLVILVVKHRCMTMVPIAWVNQTHDGLKRSAYGNAGIQSYFGVVC